MGSKGHGGGGGGTVQQLPRTTPHISSTHHRLVRQGHHYHQGAALTMTLTPDRLHGPAPPSSLPSAHPAHAAPHPSSASIVAPPPLSNFRDASSSRSLTPHPFANNPAATALKKSSHHPTHNLSLASGQSGGHVVATSACGDSGHGRRGGGEYQSVSGGPSGSHTTTPAGRHPPLPPLPAQHFYQAGTTGLFGSRIGSHTKGASYYSGGGGGGGGSDGGGGSGGSGGGRSQIVSTTPSLLLSPVSATSNGSNLPSAAASFFARAAQKVGASAKKKKHRNGGKEKAPTLTAFPTNFSTVLLKNPPPVPRNLLRPIGRTQNALSGKVRVMLRVCPVEGGHSSFLTIDAHRNQVTAFDPSTYGGHSSSSSSSAYRRPLPPKMFGFDAVFAPNDPLSEICATSLVDILQAVVGGSDGCLFCYGHARIGKTYTMVGDENPMRLGMIPSAISWLFRLINEQKEETGARFSIRVSALEVTGKQEVLKDLLADIASSAAESGSTSPGMYLREDPVCGTQLENQSELRAPTAERAAYFLDAAIAARTVPEVDEDARNSHLLFTIHVYQYRVETSNEGQNGVAGGRSRLHLIDFGSCSRNREGSALSLSALGTVIMALLNGQRHVPYRESTLTQLIKESLGSLSCHACMIVHVSPALQAYNETLQVMQLATRLQRMRTKRRSKFSSTSSEDSSCDENARIRSRMRLGVRMGTLREGSVCSTDYCTSSSEQSCDTVIYMGDNGYPISDRDLTDCEGPPRGTAIPRPRFTPPSGLVKTSSLTRVEEIIDGRQHSSLQHPPSFSNPSAAHHGSLTRQPKNGKSRLHKFVRGFTDQELMDNDLGSKGREGRSGSGRSMGGERWIDGPGSMFQNPGSTRDSDEQWVDGPPEFRMDTTTGRRSSDESGLLLRLPLKGSSNEVSHGSGNKLFTNGGGVGGGVGGVVSRIPHKAARTAKIAMLFKRETSPADEEVEVEESSSQVKQDDSKVGQSESQSGQEMMECGSQSFLLPTRPETDSCTGSSDLKHSDCIRVGAGESSTHTEDSGKACGDTSLRSGGNTSLRSGGNTSLRSGGDTSLRSGGNTSLRSGGNTSLRSGGNTSLRSGGNTSLCSNEAETGQDEVCCREAVAVLSNHVTETNIDEAILEDQQQQQHRQQQQQQHDSAKTRDCEENLAIVCDRLTSDGLDDQNCGETTFLRTDDLPHEEDVKTSHLSDESDRVASSQSPGIDADEGQEYTEATGKTDPSGDAAIQSRKSSGSKLDIESLLQQNRESIYELQMDQELEHGSRESLQRLMYGSDDDTSVWNSELRHSSVDMVGVVDEVNPFLDALSLATFNDLLGQSSNHLLHVSNLKDDITFVHLNSELCCCSSDADRQLESHSQTDQSAAAAAAAATEDAASDNVLCDAISVSDDARKSLLRKAPSDTALCSTSSEDFASTQDPLAKTSSSASSDCLDLTATSVTSVGPVPRAASTPIKPSSLRLPTGRTTVSSKLPEVKKSESSKKKPPPTPRTSSLAATKKNQSTNSEASATTTAEQTCGGSSPIAKTQSKTSSSASKDSLSVKSADEKESTGMKRLTTFGFKTTQPSLAKPSVPKATSNSSATDKKKSPSVAGVVAVPAPKIPVPASPASSTKSAKSRIALPLSNSSKKSKMSPKASSDICSRVVEANASSSAMEKDRRRLMSPYHLVTKPRISVHSSSGHGSSDGSSVVEKRIVTSKTSDSVEVSSGYESMIRDSEVTGTSSSQDSNSEYAASTSGKGRRGMKIFRKKAKGRSRSAPARWSPAVDGATVHVSRRQFVQSRAALAVIGRRSKWKTEEDEELELELEDGVLLPAEEQPLEIKTFNSEDVERMSRWRKKEAELQSLQERRSRIQELLTIQSTLRRNLARSKEILMVDRDSWNYDLHIAEKIDHDDPDYLFALEKETSVMQKRIEACKSRIMIVTCFDVTSS